MSTPVLLAQGELREVKYEFQDFCRSINIETGRNWVRLERGEVFLITEIIQAPLGGEVINLCKVLTGVGFAFASEHRVYTRSKAVK